MKKLLCIASIIAVALFTASCNKEEKVPTGGDDLPSAAGLVPVVTVNGGVATFSLPAGTTGLNPIWWTNETGDFVFAGTGDGFQKSFYATGTFKVRMYVSNAAGQSADYAEAEFKIEEAAGAVTLKGGYDYDSDFNIWKPADKSHTYSQYTATGPSWTVLDNPEIINVGNSYSFTYETETNDQWQAQFFIIPTEPINCTADKTWDFSCVVLLDQTVNVTFKLTQDGDDGNFLFTDRIEVPAGQEFVFGYSNIALEKDVPNVKMVFDFGGCPAGTNVSLGRIVLKDHANDDGCPAMPEKGTEPDPVDIPEEPVDSNCEIDVAGPGNLWNSCTPVMANWYSAADWSGGMADPGVWVTEYSEYKVVIPEGIGGSEWMGQTQFQTGIALSAAKKYDFSVTITSTEACVINCKLALTGDDTAHSMFYKNDIKLEAGVTRVFTVANLVPDIDYNDMCLFIDLGRTPAGAEVVMKDFCVQEHKDVATFNIDAATNLWRSATITMSNWYSGADWSGALTAEYTLGTNNDYTVTIPEGIGGSEWMGQNQFKTGIALSAAKKYDFCATFHSTTETVFTVKLALTGDDTAHSMYYNGNVSIAADTDYTFKLGSLVPDIDYNDMCMFIDLGRTAAGTVFTMKDVCLQEHID